MLKTITITIQPKGHLPEKPKVPFICEVFLFIIFSIEVYFNLTTFTAGDQLFSNTLFTSTELAVIIPFAFQLARYFAKQLKYVFAWLIVLIIVLIILFLFSLCWF